MTYLIFNKYANQTVTTYELRNESHEEEVIRTNITDYEIGQYVDGLVVNGKMRIQSILNKPSNFLDYYVHGEKSTDELKTEISKFISIIKNENYQIILNETVNKNDDFYLYPAAKAIHHAYIGGLCEHTISMLTLAERFVENYKLDSDLLYTGIILHDYGKIHELSEYGLNYSLAGNLLGHITMCVEEIGNIAINYEMNDKVDIIALKHMILSHHGRMDYGSPKEPMLIEAYVLSMIDEVDAKINLLNKVLHKQEKGKLSTPINAMDRRRFIKL